MNATKESDTKSNTSSTNTLAEKYSPFNSLPSFTDFENTDYSTTDMGLTYQKGMKMAKDVPEDFEFEESYNTPMSIVLLNFALVTSLMIFIGIAVYPAVKKYCDANVSVNNRNAFWIEDTEEITTADAFSPTTSDSSLAVLLNRSTSTDPVLGQNSTMECGLQVLSEVNIT